jgi:hypothetical protein
VKRIHVLRVEGEPTAYAALIEAIRVDGGRVGWLELGATGADFESRPEVESEAGSQAGSESAVVPPRLEQAADLGVLRAVAVGSTRTVSVKPRRGQTVTRDLLREHFRGCRLVLVTGSAEAPLLVAAGEGWTVKLDGVERRHTTESLARALRKPKPFGEPPDSDKS